MVGWIAAKHGAVREDDHSIRYFDNPCCVVDSDDIADGADDAGAGVRIRIRRYSLKSHMVDSLRLCCGLVDVLVEDLK